MIDQGKGQRFFFEIFLKFFFWDFLKFLRKKFLTLKLADRQNADSDFSDAAGKFESSMAEITVIFCSFFFDLTKFQDILAEKKTAVSGYRKKYPETSNKRDLGKFWSFVLNFMNSFSKLYENEATR